MVTSYKKIQDKNFLGSWDLITGCDNDGVAKYGEVKATIQEVKQEEVIDLMKNNGNGKKKTVVIYFKENLKPMICNSTNLKAIEKATKTQFIEHWVGKQITIYVETGVYMPGTKKADNITTDALRIRPFAPVNNIKYICEDCGCEVEEKIAVYADKKLGVVVCAECGKKRMEGNV